MGWLAPVFATTLYAAHLGDRAEWVLAITDAVVAVIGLSVAWVLWRGAPTDAGARARSSSSGSGTGTSSTTRSSAGRVRSWPGSARWWSTAGSSTGRSTGRPAGRATGSGVRELQTGYVRNYALGIALGLAAIIAFMISRAWWS